MYLCADGHLTRHTPEIYEEMHSRCNKCNAKIVWWLQVDQTNDEGVTPILVPYKIYENKKCETCGHVERGERQYIIPKNIGHVIGVPNVPVEDAYIHFPESWGQDWIDCWKKMNS